MDVASLFFKTVALRPYVFIFLVAFLFVGTHHLGLKRTLIFWGIAWVVAFLSEYSSTRNAFPYGFYHYTGSTRGKELYISNVPFMDSLSYSFLLYASYAMALFSLPGRSGKRILILTALYMMMIDVVIDPVALRGSRWFLGQIYYYDYEGFYFGVPLSNALGWGLVGLVSLFFYQQIDRFLGAGFKDWGIRSGFLSSWGGVGLFYGVLVFNLAVTYWIGEVGLFIAGCLSFYFLPL